MPLNWNLPSILYTLCSTFYLLSELVFCSLVTSAKEDMFFPLVCLLVDLSLSRFSHNCYGWLFTKTNKKQLIRFFGDLYWRWPAMVECMVELTDGKSAYYGACIAEWKPMWKYQCGTAGCWEQYIWSAFLQRFALCECFLAVSDVDFRMASRSWKEQLRKNIQNHGKMVMRRCSHAHTQTVGIHLSTNGTVYVISVQSMVDVSVVISLSYSAAVLRTVGVHSTLILL